MLSTLTTDAGQRELAQSAAFPGCLVTSALGRYQENHSGYVVLPKLAPHTAMEIGDRLQTLSRASGSYEE
jgi:hypothetical protein